MPCLPAPLQGIQLVGGCAHARPNSISLAPSINGVRGHELATQKGPPVIITPGPVLPLAIALQTSWKTSNVSPDQQPSDALFPYSL
ncbi:hypothetical protein M440DRAFT_1068574 [Trichoderma longibrachiatum ATCC 18648]|uniref:Uncharacterized protein n=1 Tax=Trichoderma longibrachiatum ATCC 18648 TaxID=983965 RepID=A0A2T4BUF8_TRILO|nr:hypothetical protein M440DRAFT_1068574 [Trichoderma longibrachiatum ATCC 18648]